MKIHIEMDEKDKQRAIKLLVGVIAAIAAIAMIIGLVFAFKGNNGNDSDSSENAAESTGGSANSGTGSGSTDKGSTDSGNKGNETTSGSNGNTVADGTQTKVTYKLNKSNGWEGNGKVFAQYDLSVNNGESEKISDWSLVISLNDGEEISQQWNCNVAKSGNEYTITPVDFNKEIAAGGDMSGVGLIISMNSARDLDNSRYTFTTASNSNLSVNNSGIVVSGEYKPSDGNSGNSGDSNSANNSSNSGDSNNGGNNGGNNSSNDNSSSGSSGSSVSANTTNPTGGLHVEGTHLVDASGNVVQLRGVSTHGIQWGEMKPYVNQGAIQTLHDDWGANVFRIAMYVEESGYLAGGNQSELKQIIDDGVRYATELGMYAIIDWHVLNFSPDRYTSQAQEFFSEMAQKYSSNDHVIYEICNEPVGADWNSNIKPYAEAVISSIRQYDSDAVIIVGTNTWSQDVDAVIGNRIDDANVMYTLHFYAATHTDYIRNKLTTALNAGIPVFVSECSICDASGNGGIDYNQAEIWKNLLNSNSISFIAWSLSSKNETASLISPGCSKLSGWTDDDLSETGKWFKNAIQGN